MGDGNLHPTFLTNEKDPDEMHRVELAMKEIFDRALALGGTITGEPESDSQRSRSSKTLEAS